MDLLIKSLSETIKAAELINDFELSNRLHLAGLNDSINNYSSRITPDYFDFVESEFR